jgi:hypothetical protein
MEEIQWYGAALDLDRDKVGRLTRITAELMCNLNLKDQDQVHMPHTYIYNLEDARRITGDTISWPVSVKVSVGDAVFCPSMLVQNIDEFKMVLDKVEKEAPDAEFLVSLPILNSDNVSAFTASFFYYIAHDYVLVQDLANKRRMVISSDNSGIFRGYELDRSLVYRVISTGDGWFIDNVIDYDDPRLTSTRNKKLSDILTSSDDLEQFTFGYRNGFGDQQNSPPKGKIGLADDVYVDDAYYFGFMIGRSLKSSLVQILTSAGVTMTIAFDSQSLTNKVGRMIAKSFLSKNDYAKLTFLAGLHDKLAAGIKKDDEEDFMRGLNFVFPAGSLNSTLQHARSVAEVFWSHGESRPNAFDNWLQVFGDFSEDCDISIEKDITYSMAQVRILHKYEQSLEFRVQIKDFKSEVRAISGDEKQVLFEGNNSSLEFGLSVAHEELDNNLFPSWDAFVKHVSEHNHSGESTAGTTAVYIPIEITEDGFKTKEHGTWIASWSKFLQWCKNNNLMDTSKVEGVFA